MRPRPSPACSSNASRSPPSARSEQDRGGDRLVELEADEALLVQGEQVMKVGRSPTRGRDHEHGRRYRRELEGGVEEAIEPARD